ncbi:MAG: hypothetical protein ACK5O7_02785 [Holosporales bacterium]
MRYVIKTIDAFRDEDIRDLHEILCSSVENYPLDVFMQDFRRKTCAILYIHEDKCVGFSGQTLVKYDATTCIMYTGMTVIRPEFWGNSALYKSYAQVFRSVLAALEGKTLYHVFYALSYQSYGFAPFLYQRFYPCWDVDRHDEKAGAIGLWMAEQVFGGDVNRERGVITPTQGAEFLTRDVTDLLEEKGSRDYIDFFHARNPGFRQGHLMVCAARLGEDNLNPMAKRIYDRHAPDEALVDHLRGVTSTA